jgi:hypothetical protein
MACSDDHKIIGTEPKRESAHNGKPRIYPEKKKCYVKSYKIKKYKIGWPKVKQVCNGIDPSDRRFGGQPDQIGRHPAKHRVGPQSQVVALFVVIDNLFRHPDVGHRIVLVELFIL